jgi:hypothetical protein
MDAISELNKRGMYVRGSLKKGRWYLTLERSYAYVPPMEIRWTPDPPLPSSHMIQIRLVEDVEVDYYIMRDDFETVVTYLSQYLDKRYEEELHKRGLA